MLNYICKACEDEVQAKNKPHKCDKCQCWNTFALASEVNVNTDAAGNVVIPVPLDQVKPAEYPRIITGIEALDRVAGGGLVVGGIYLLAGEPGDGKSTLVAQILGRIKIKSLYCSGEETKEQIKMRTDRIDVHGKHINMYEETNLERIFEVCKNDKIRCLVIDSVQTVETEACKSAVGSTNQIRDCGNMLVKFCKPRNITTIIIGHVTKDGELAGPKTLEHMVDAPMYLDKDSENEAVRILRATKNRFGSTREKGYFEMTAAGLLPFKREEEDDRKNRQQQRQLKQMMGTPHAQSQ